MARLVGAYLRSQKPWWASCCSWTLAIPHPLDVQAHRLARRRALLVLLTKADKLFAQRAASKFLRI